MHFINALSEFSPSQRTVYYIVLDGEDLFRFKNKPTMNVKNQWKIFDIENDL